MLFKSIATAALIASAAAAPLHQHHQHQRDVDIVTETTVLYVNAPGGPTLALTGVPTSTATAANTAPPQNAPSNVQSAPADSGVPSSAGSSTPQPSGGAGAAGARGVTWTPYTTGACKSASQIQSEFAELTGYDIIRIYGVDCDQVAQVLAAKSPHQKVFATLVNMNSISSDVQTLASAVKGSGSWDDIYAVSIGNELVNSGQANSGQVAGYVNEGKGALKAQGYTGPVVSIDTFIAIMEHKDLCQYSDFIAINAHPFFDGNVDAEGAGDWVIQQIQGVASTCGSKTVMVTETGWPYKGQANNKAVPSVQNQQAAIKSIKGSCGDDVLLFSGFDEDWKADGQYGVEKFWGFIKNQ